VSLAIKFGSSAFDVTLSAVMEMFAEGSFFDVYFNGDTHTLDFYSGFEDDVAGTVPLIADVWNHVEILFDLTTDIYVGVKVNGALAMDYTIELEEPMGVSVNRFYLLSYNTDTSTPTLSHVLIDDLVLGDSSDGEWLGDKRCYDIRPVGDSEKVGWLGSHTDISNSPPDDNNMHFDYVQPNNPATYTPIMQTFNPGRHKICAIVPWVRGSVDEVGYPSPDSQVTVILNEQAGENMSIPSDVAAEYEMFTAIADPDMFENWTSGKLEDLQIVVTSEFLEA
jgi:hypothetical protein